jgi:hypothetical protein
LVIEQLEGNLVLNVSEKRVLRRKSDERERERGRENCVIRSFIICTLHQTSG